MRLIFLIAVIQFSVLVALADMLIPPHRPHVKSGAGKVEFSDNLKDHDSIIKIVESKLEDLRNCYSRALKRNRQTMGEVTVQWELSSRGKPTKTKFQENKIGNWDLNNCIMKKFKTWVFPATNDGRPGRLVYSFEFREKEDAPPES